MRILSRGRPKKRKFTSVISINLLEEKEVFVPPSEQLTNLQPGPSCNTRPIGAVKAKGIGIKFTMGENHSTWTIK